MSPRAAAVPAPEPTSTRDAILDAAERCFADRGFAGVSMREIAAEAGLRNQATLYHHFTDKRPLYTEGLRLLQGAVGPWEPTDLPQLATGLYHLIFGYFADAALLETIVEEDPRAPTAVARQRRFLKAAVAQLLGVAPGR